ncbi:sensor histidine kinase [Candidatus Formimonas warabiya]|uniref:histidine kinase n=1 Tax=Formimonas warabiya TaxID=1761012 RepID=A0A3G1KRP1_FORW1|nr:HAMP domain-containing sensor histidine kinase [Candidatus Formimonas warabiya]ATW25152.1 two-component sensor histidine kinase [Candidatus Formimonas warabiya]
MFRKLRNKFLMLNMSMTSLVMIAAFATVYFITYNSIHSEIQNKLNARSEMQLEIKGNDLPDHPEKEGTMSHAQYFSSDDPPSFHIEVDGNGKILNINSFMDLPDEVYEKAAETAWKNKGKNPTITLGGKQWQYAVTQVTKHVMEGNGQEYTVVEDKYQIVFLDVTASRQTLFRLLTTLIFVGFMMLFVIFIISLYFANRAIKPIAEAWEKQKQFVADASHELKTPLSIINANYDALLANQEETIKSQLKWLGYIRIGTDRMTKLVNDLLSLAKIEDIHSETGKMPFNISTAIHDVMLSMEAVMMEKGIHLSPSIEPDIIVKSDSEKVKQAVTILFDNAIKYTNEKGQIGVSLIKSKRQVIFSIRNSGKGIAKQDLPKVFDRFYRADPSRAHEGGGYGLGLSIVKTILDRLGGEIHATSEEDGFTTFTFTLGGIEPPNPPRKS